LYELRLERASAGARKPDGARACHRLEDGGRVSPGQAASRSSSPAPILARSTAAPPLAGEPLESSAGAQHWYDGNTWSAVPTEVIQPPGRTRSSSTTRTLSAPWSPPRRTARLVADNCCWGTAALDYGVLRDNGRVHFDLSVRRRSASHGSRWTLSRRLQMCETPLKSGPTPRRAGGTNLRLGGTANLVPGQPQAFVRSVRG